MHNLLLLPLLGIAVFFIGLPLGVSIPLYILILIINNYSGCRYLIITLYIEMMNHRLEYQDNDMKIHD